MREKFNDNLNSTTIKVFVSNVGAYNAGVLTGEWTTLPVKDVKTIFEADRKKNGELEGYGDEFFITDYEAPFEVHEYEDLCELNQLAKALKDNYLDTVADVFYSLDDREQINVIEPVEFDEDNFEELTAGMSRVEVARAAVFGDVNWNDELIRFNDYGNIETLTVYEWHRELNVNGQEIIEEFAKENGIKLF